VVRVGDHDELIQASAGAVRGYDPATGKELWVLNGPTVEVVPAVVVGKDLLYSASGRNGPFLGLRPGGNGDVTDTHLVWRAVRGGPHVPTPIYLDGRLYTVNDTGIATCLDAETGKNIWYDRIRDSFSASPIEAAGLLYFPAESGVTYVLKVGDKFEVVAKNDLGSPILASPAVVGGRLILRTQDELVCIGEKK
jgi:outer membrane protein assembly factor BamB